MRRVATMRRFVPAQGYVIELGSEVEVTNVDPGD